MGERTRGGRRVPAMAAQNLNECGAACLAMLACHRGRPTTVSEVAGLDGIGRDGSTAASLVDAGRRLGLSVRGLSVHDPELAGIRLPAMVHWRFRHWIVVESVRSDGVRVVDPSRGRITLDLREFGDGFTGVVLVVDGEPDRRPARPPRRTGEFLRMVGAVPGVRAVLAEALAAAVVLQLFLLAGPALTKVAVDDVAASGGTTSLTTVLFGLIAALAALYLLVYLLRLAALLRLRARLDVALMGRFLDHVLALPIPALRKRSSGDLVMRLSSNVEVREILGAASLSSILDGLTVLVGVAVLFWISPVLGVVGGTLVVAQAAVFLLGYSATRRRIADELRTQAEFQGVMVDMLRSLTGIKATGGEEGARVRWDTAFRTSVTASLRRAEIVNLVTAVSRALVVFTPLVVLVIALGLVRDGTLTIGTAVASLSVAAVATVPVGTVLSALQGLQLAGGYIERILDVLDDETEPAGLPPAPPLGGEIGFDGVGYRYSAGAPWTARGVDLRVDPGRTVAVVGPTGSGKSTLVALALGLVVPTEGRVTVDGRDLATVDARSYRSQVGVVLQDMQPASGTIRANIAAGGVDPEPADIVDAARTAMLHDEVVSWPLGYDTLVGEGGGALSGGQRQRLALARALVGRPRLLVLDEADSHLDPATGGEVLARLARLDCSVLMISHQVEAIRRADRIVVLDGGRVVGNGTHDELLTVCPQYAALVRLQGGHTAAPGEDRAR